MVAFVQGGHCPGCPYLLPRPLFNPGFFSKVVRHDETSSTIYVKWQLSFNNFLSIQISCGEIFLLVVDKKLLNDICLVTYIVEFVSTRRTTLAKRPGSKSGRVAR